MLAVEKHMFKSLFGGLVLVFALAAAQATSGQVADDRPQFDGSKLVRPVNYREWVFLGAGLGMTYSENAGSGPQSFTNVFVNPSAHRAFLKNGTWPDGTTLILEIRASASEGSINKGGHYQTKVVGMEAHVKDARLPGGWAFFNLAGPGGLVAGAEPLAPAQASRCVECHQEHGAVDTTFVQFYPTLIDVARRAGTFTDDAAPARR
jgi:hypothetical protein